MTNTDMIKELRALTQAGMKDCKESLEETNWDLQKAVDLVKTKGLNIVSGREGRAASEGVVAIALVSAADKATVMVEVNCQTDFVAKSPGFLAFAQKTAENIGLDTISDRAFTVDEMETDRAHLVSTTKENVVIRRWWVEQAISQLSFVTSYKHSNNKIGVLLTIVVDDLNKVDNQELRQLGDDLAMQVAAMNPLAVSVDRLDPVVVERQKSIFEAQLTELKKPQAAWAKILEGKFNKWYTDVCLLNQESILMPKTSVQKVIQNLSEKLQTNIQVVNFVRCEVGEGLEKKEQINLAEEVAKMM